MKFAINFKTMEQKRIGNLKGQKQIKDNGVIGIWE